MKKVIWLQLVSLQTNEARSLNAGTIVFTVAIHNNAPASLAPPHHSAISSSSDSTAFEGGTLVLLANRFWSDGAVHVPRIDPQHSVTVHIITRPIVGYKTIDELDVEARFELRANGATYRVVPCAGSVSTDGAIWHKSMIEFAGDVVHAEPAANRETINLLFVSGGQHHYETAALINTALTTLSFSKHPVEQALIGCENGDESTATAPTVVAHAPLVDECAVRLLEARTHNTSQLIEILKGNYESTTTEDEVNRQVDAVVVVIPAQALAQSHHAIGKFHQLNRTCANAIIAITHSDDKPAHTAAAVQIFGVSASRVFCTPVYNGEAKRIASVEQPCLAMLLAATRQAMQNQRSRHSD